MEEKKILITGAAGFIGHHLAKHLKEQGHYVRGVDWKEPEYGFEGDEFHLRDMRDLDLAKSSCGDMDQVYALAADMGGMGFIQDPANQYKILWNNTMANFNTLEAARERGVEKYLYTSSACVYPEYLQEVTEVKPLKEEDAYPAKPQDSYGWEKLQAEHLCEAAHDLDTRVVRFHNIYGPEGTWQGGREKAPAALCRKVIQAKKDGSDHIEIWGDGEQTRSFCYIDDCLKGLDLIMNGEYSEPVNLGRDEMISINGLAKIIMAAGGVDLDIKHVEGPEGVRGRNSDNSMFRERYGWEPQVDLLLGLKKTYNWIESQMIQK